MLVPVPRRGLFAQKATLQVALEQQASLDGGHHQARRAFIFPLCGYDSFVSATRTADFAYGLDKSICSVAAKHSLSKGAEACGSFPCLSADRRTLLPIVTGELKVSGGRRASRFQQALYASYYIMSWLILRYLRLGPADPTRPMDELLDGIHHYTLGISPDLLEIWQYRPTLDDFDGNIRVSAQMLCCGSPSDQAFMEDIYVPYRRLILKRGIAQQILKLVPDVEAYAALPGPRPFDAPETVCLKVADLRPASYDLGSSTFGNGPGPDQDRMQVLIDRYDEARALLADTRKKRKSSRATELAQGDSFTESDSSQLFSSQG